MNKRKFITDFDEFLYRLQEVELNHGKCYFKLEDGYTYQGWIEDIGTDKFKFRLSGPLAPDEPIFIVTEQIDVDTFSYWDAEIGNWTDYFGPDKFDNRKKTKPVKRKLFRTCCRNVLKHIFR